MKRGHYEPGAPSSAQALPSGGSGGAVSKRPRGDKFEIRVLVPSKVAGSIIGKGGSNIQKLRSENSAVVRIPDCPGPERVMTIQTPECESAVNVLRHSIPFMTEEAVKSGPMGANNGSNEVPEGPQEIRLLIHQSIVGGIIGRAGFKIKEIRDASGANVKVYQSCAPNSSDRCVSVSGSVDKLCLALKEVFQVISATDIKGLDKPYDPNNFDTYYASGYGGYGGEMESGGFGGGSRGGAHRGGGIRRDDYRGRGARRGYGFPEEQQAGVYDNYYAGGGTTGGARRTSRGPPAGGTPFTPEDAAVVAASAVAATGEDDGKIKTNQVTIPKEHAGAIIGPGGTRIRKIRSDSKANITIDEPLPGSNDRIITISGSDLQIQTAQYLLQQSVREHSNSNMGASSYAPPPNVPPPPQQQPQRY
eukprot:TRINITY_DN1221_c0_g1_i1.p1 TRINITY_DN1221_c0_g1~~TRINITY_DN1221_c0_g1_i1.p1  ORF type:complete len:418 (-),score=132.64 TRINITY_DN1221_c0_g1_i1:527-1780(-)